MSLTSTSNEPLAELFFKMPNALPVPFQALGSKPRLVRQPCVPGVREQRKPFALGNAIVGLFQFAPACVFGLSRYCFAFALTAFLNFLTDESEVIPPNFSALIHAHFGSPFLGLPPFFPFSRAISRMRPMPSRLTRAA